MPEKKLPKYPDFSSIPCDEGGKRHIKGCPHKITTDPVRKQIEENKDFIEAHKPQTLWGNTPPDHPTHFTMSYGRKDRATFNKEEWEVAYIELLEGNLRTVSRHRAILGTVLASLAIASILVK